jgi:hypothetical protein
VRVRPRRLRGDVQPRDTVCSDRFESIGAIYEGSGVDERDNVATVHVRTHDPDVERLVLEHFKAHAMLRVVVDRRMRWLGGQGALTVVARHSDCRPVENADCLVTPQVPVDWSEDRRTTGDTGTCRFKRIDAIPIEIVLERERSPLAQKQGMIVAADTVVVRIFVE